MLGDKHATKEWENYELPLPLVENLIRDLANLHVHSIHIAGGGEPFMHPHFLDIVKKVKEKKILCDITTNLTLADRIMLEKLVKLQVNSITISVWAGNADTYHALHPSASRETFYKIRDLLQYLAFIKKDSPFPLVRICNVISRVNFREIEQMIDFANAVKANEYFFQVMDPVEGKTESLLLSDSERAELLSALDNLNPKMEHLEKSGKVRACSLADFKRRISSAGAKEGFYEAEAYNQIPCYAGWIFSRITADGNVNFCLKTDEYPLGNIFKNSFKKIWRSKDYAMFRKMKITGLKHGRYALRCKKTCDNYEQNKMVHEKLFSCKS
jgi:MoaA/NifB/PqqE/SkfB family radical SAM enzyme